MSIFSDLKANFLKRPIWQQIILCLALAVFVLVAWPLAIATLYGLIVKQSISKPATQKVLIAAMVIPALVMEVAWGQSTLATLTKPPAPTVAVNSQKTKPTVVPTSQVQGATTQANPQAKVVQAISGDTLDVQIDGQTQRVKLIGLQAPAVVGQTTGKAECFGPESQVFLDSLLRGRMVELITDQIIGSQTDQAEWQRYVVMDDQTNVNQLMLEAGLARPTTTGFEQAATFQAYAEAAKASKKGLWLNCEKPATTTKNLPVNQTIQPSVSPTPTFTNPPAVSPIPQF